EKNGNATQGIMSGRFGILIGLFCLACAFVGGGLGATEARAVTKGTTMFTCKKKSAEGGGGFSRKHCKPADAVTSGAKYEHVAVPEGVTTPARATLAETNAETTGSTPFVLHATLAGILLEIEASAIDFEGWVKNQKDSNGEHYIEG